MKIFLIVLIMFFAFHALVVCQTTSDSISFVNLKKNVVYGTFGLYPGSTFNINYERQIIHPVKSPLSSINIRLGYGVYGDLAGSEKLVLLSSNFIFGSGSGHFETDFGAAYLFDIVRTHSENKTGVTPIINAGYRFQRKNGQFVFRTGIGWPDCIYVSLGFTI